MIIFRFFLVTSSIVPLGFVGAYLKLLFIDKPKLDIVSLARLKFKTPPSLHRINTATTAITTTEHNDDMDTTFISSSSSSSSSMNTATSYNYTLSHKYSFNIPNPSYVQILKDGFLSVTSFSFLKKGSINQFDLGINSNNNSKSNDSSSSSSSRSNNESSMSIHDDNDSVSNSIENSNKNNINDNRIATSSTSSSSNTYPISSSSSINSGSSIPKMKNPRITHSKRYSGEYLWPNELTSFEDLSGNKMTIIPDGFLFPGQDDGGLYMIQEPALTSSSSSGPSDIMIPVSDTQSQPVAAESDVVNSRLSNEDETTSSTSSSSSYISSTPNIPSTTAATHTHRHHRTSLLTSAEAEAAAEAAAQIPIRITANKKGWFYHRAVYVRLPIPADITGSTASSDATDSSGTSTAGTTRRYREGILTARAYKPLFGRGRGELVWINLPSAATHAVVKTDDTMSVSPSNNSEHATGHNNSNNDDDDEWVPWQETVLVEGPDVMFETVDIDPNDSSIEIISAHFFGQKITVHSLEAVPPIPLSLSSTDDNDNDSSHSNSSKKSPSSTVQKRRRRQLIKISDTYLLDNAVGQPYGLCLASMPSLSLASSSSSSSVRTSTFISSSSSSSLLSQQQTSKDSLSTTPPLFLSKGRELMENATVPPSATAGLTGSSGRSSSSNNEIATSGNDKGRVGLKTNNKKKIAVINSSRSSNSATIPVNVYSGSSTSVTSQQPVLLSQTSTSLSSSSSSVAISPPVYTHLLVTTHECSYDIWSTIKMAVLAVFGRYPRIRAGAAVQHEYSRRYLGRGRGSSSSGIGSGVSTSTSASDLSVDSSVASVEGLMRTRRDDIYKDNQSNNNSNSNYPDNNNNKSSRQKGLWSGVGESFFGAGGNLFGVEGMFFSGVGKIANTKAGVGGSLFAYELPKLRRSSNTNGQATVSATSKDPLSYIPSSIKNFDALKSSSKSPVGDMTATTATTTTSTIVNINNGIVQDVVDNYDTPRYLSWRRHTLCTGFKVKGWGGIFSPGAPGFPYVFNMPRQQQQSKQSPEEALNGGAPVTPAMPLILLAGDCTGSAYIFTPRSSGSSASAVSVANNKSANNNMVTTASTSSSSSSSSKASINSSGARRKRKKFNGKFGVNNVEQDDDDDEEKEEVMLAPVYDLAFEIECGATVGSAAAALATDGTNSVDIFLPSYELNQIHALRLSLHEQHGTSA